MVPARRVHVVLAALSLTAFGCVEQADREVQRSALSSAAPSVGGNGGSKIRYRVNSLLVKVSDAALPAVKVGNPLDTGIPSLDRANREFGAIGFRRLVDNLAQDNLPATRQMSAWHEVKLPGPDDTAELDPSVAVDDSSPVRKLRDRLSRDPNIAVAELNTIVSVRLVPNDPYYSSPYPTSHFGNISQWGPQAVGAPAAWDVTQGDPSIIVAVVDTGVDYNHPDLAGQVINQFNIAKCQPGPDCFGHGTHVAGIIAASLGNGIGVAGMCPKCRILSVRVLGADGSGPLSDVVNGMTYAADHGARIINLSLGGAGPNQSSGDAVAYDIAHGALPVISMGNNSSDANQTDPVYWYDALAVVASDQGGAKATFSNFGVRSDVAAPGVGVLSTMTTYPSTIQTQFGYFEDYDALSGTSMAAPMAAGTAGLVLSRNPNLTPRQLKGIVMAAAGDGQSWSNDLGFGVINAARAVAAAGTTDATAPTIGVVSPPSGSTVKQAITVTTGPSDNVAVHHVDIINNGTRLVAPGTARSVPAWSVLYPTTIVWNGLQSLTLNAIDTSGNSSQASVQYDVENAYITRTVHTPLCDPATANCPKVYWDPSDFTVSTPAVMKFHMSWTNGQWLGGYGGSLSAAVSGFQRGKGGQPSRSFTISDGVFPNYWPTTEFDDDFQKRIVLLPGYRLSVGANLGALYICFGKGCDPRAGTGSAVVDVTFTYPQ